MKDIALRDSSSRKMEEQNIETPEISPETSPSKSGKPRIKLPGRRVNFPEDETIISGKIDAPNPWKDAKETSTEELIASYHAACVQNKVKPNSKILQQLQTVRDFTQRQETFSLKGEKVDLRVVETLEELFKRVQFNTVDLESCSLEDESAAALFDMVEFYESAIRLIVAANRSIGARGWQAAARMLKRTSCLECLDARNTNWTEHSMPMLARALRADMKLSVLHLEGCNLSGRPLFLLMVALKVNASIRDLFLAENRLVPSDAIQIGAMLKHNRGLRLLDLRNNHLQDVGLSHLCEGLLDQLEGQLLTLVLWNNQLTQNGMTHLAKTLPMVGGLETLNLGQNHLGNDGVHILKDGLMKNKSLLRLGLYSCRISDQGAIALAEYLADNAKIVRLDLRENDIRTGGLMALSLAMKVNKLLLRLDLDKDIKRDTQMRGYEELQRNLQQEIIGLLQRNRELAKLAEEKAEKEGAADNEKRKPQVQLDSPEGPISPEASQLVTHVMLKNTDNEESSPNKNWDSNHEPLSGIEVHHVNGAKQTTNSSSGTVNGHTNTPSSISKTQSSVPSSSSSTTTTTSIIKNPQASVEHTMQSVPTSNHSSSSSSGKSGSDGEHSPPGIRITDSIKLLTHPVQPMVNQGVAAAVAPAAALAGITVAPAVALMTQSNPYAADDSTTTVASSPSSSTISKTLPDDNTVHHDDSDPSKSGATVVVEQQQQQQSSAIGIDESIPKDNSTEQSVLDEIGDEQKSNVDIELADSSDVPEIFMEENPAYSSPSRDVMSLANGLLPPSSLATTTHYTTESTLGAPRQTNRYMGAHDVEFSGVDDFEKELNEMLASVKTTFDADLPSPSRSAHPAQELLNPATPIPDD
ncbi:uncharacterized protein [Amphiura filiformis]|uniref:uncharacterized protein n=1 Tax=Amphiura filiformis TaxID=82378 RepID=UPI003B228631